MIRAALLALAILPVAAQGQTVRLEVTGGTIFDADGEVSLTLSPLSRRELAKFTGQNIGRTIDVLLDGHVVSRPRIMQPIQGPGVMIFGDLDDPERRALIERAIAGEAVLQLRKSAE